MDAQPSFGPHREFSQAVARQQNMQLSDSDTKLTQTLGVAGEALGGASCFCFGVAGELANTMTATVETLASVKALSRWRVMTFEAHNAGGAATSLGIPLPECFDILGLSVVTMLGVGLVALPVAERDACHYCVRSLKVASDGAVWVFQRFRCGPLRDAS